MALFTATYGMLASVLTLAAGATMVAASAGAFTPKPKMPEMPEMPKTIKETAAETITKATTQAQEAIRQKQVAARRSKSIYTSPLGLAGEAETTKKYLLGQ